jgi:hypothetical protein
MTTGHINTCKNNCIYAKKVVWLSRAGESEDWLYRCMKLEERIITTDSVIHELGCATFTTTSKPCDNQDDLVKRAQEMLTEINLKIEEDKKKAGTTDSLAVTEPVKPVEKKPEPLVVQAPEAIPPQHSSTDRITVPATIPPVVPADQTHQVTGTEEPAKKKRGRKPKQVSAAEPEPHVSITPEIPKEPIKEEVIKDGGTTEGTKL